MKNTIRNLQANTKKRHRHSLREWAREAQWHKEQAIWFCKSRHDWSKENGGYEYCRAAFLRHRRAYKRLQVMVLKWAQIVCSDYVD